MKCSPEKREALRLIAGQRIGMAGYAAILSDIRFNVLSTSTLAEKHGVSRLLILGVMRHCLRAGIVHRVNWHRTVAHSRLVPCWALGGEGDISMPQYEEKTRRPRRGPSTLCLLTTVLQMLGEHAHTRAEVTADLCMHEETTSRVISILRKAGLIHIASWNKPPIGTSVAEFKAGGGRDAPRPARVGNSVASMAGYKERRKQLSMLQALAGVPQQSMRAVA